MATLIAKDVCGIAKSVRGGQPVEKERIEAARSDGREKEGQNGEGDTGSGILPKVFVVALALPVRRRSERVVSSRSL